MIALRLYLFLGLVLHKLVWEAMKRRRGPSGAARPSGAGFDRRLIKAVKVAVLLGIAAQTWMPDILPISADAHGLRLAGVAVYTLGLLVAVAARVQLGRNWSDLEDAGVKPDQAVVSRGLYGYVRHPIYVADVALLIGLELSLNSWLVLPALALAPMVLRRAVQEERMLMTALPGYNAYCERTKRFIPFVV